MATLDLGVLKISIGVDSEVAESKLGKVASVLGNGVVKAGKAAVAGVAAVGTALIASAEATEEFRGNMSKLNTAFTTNGHTAQEAKDTYNDLYAILGDSGQATEAAAHLALLTDNEKELQEWTKIAAGVYGTFGDSLPIEGLTEAANETAKTGQLTGNLADALNWVGIAEDDFQLKLDACSTEQERQTLITQTLSQAYGEAADSFNKTNGVMLEAKRLQSEYTNSLAGVGGAVDNIKNQVMVSFLPSVNGMLNGLTGILNGAEGAEEQFTTSIQSFAVSLATEVPKFVTLASGIISSLVEGITSAIPQLVPCISTVINELVSLIVTNLPLLLQAGVEILVGLINGISQALPELIPQVVSVILAIVDILIQNIPLLIDCACQLITGLAQGLIQAIPVIIEKLPEIINSIVSALLESIPIIIECGIDLLTALIDAMPEIIDSIVEALPEIIDGIITALIENIDQIIDCGIELLSAIVTNIPKIIELIVAKLPELIKGIVQGILDKKDDIIACGENLIKGLWDGINNVKEWIKEKIRGWCDSISSEIKEFFGIHSPSRLFAEYGKYMAEGLGEGLEENADYALDAVDELNKGIEEAFNPSLAFDSSVYGYGTNDLSAIARANTTKANKIKNTNPANITQNNYFTAKETTAYEQQLQIKRLNRDLIGVV